jgi:CheY-like chemotaxis protein
VDLLITDLSMPSMNGIELARRVREFLPTLPIVLMTGWGEIIPREDLSAYGIRRVLTKPVTLQTWRDTLLQVAGLRPDDPELPIR